MLFHSGEQVGVVVVGVAEGDRAEGALFILR